MKKVKKKLRFKTKNLFGDKDFIFGNKKWQTENRKNLKELLLTEIPNYFAERMIEISDDIGVNSDHQDHINKNPLGHCMSISSVVAEVLNVYGIKCRPYKVAVAFCNPPAMKIINEQSVKALADIMTERKISKNSWSEGDPYTVGLGVADPKIDYVERPYLAPLHAVIGFHQDQSILDMTAIQATRPEKGMIITNYWSSMNSLPSFVWSFAMLEGDSFVGGVQEHPDLKGIMNHILNRVGSIFDVKKIPQVQKLNRPKI